MAILLRSAAGTCLTAWTPAPPGIATPVHRSLMVVPTSHVARVPQAPVQAVLAALPVLVQAATVRTRRAAKAISATNHVVRGVRVVLAPQVRGRAVRAKASSVRHALTGTQAMLPAFLRTTPIQVPTIRTASRRVRRARKARVPVAIVPVATRQARGRATTVRVRVVHAVQAGHPAVATAAHVAVTAEKRALRRPFPMNPGRSA